MVKTSFQKISIYNSFLKKINNWKNHPEPMKTENIGKGIYLNKINK